MAQIGQWVEKSRVRLGNEHAVLTPVEEKDREGWRAQALDPDIWTHFSRPAPGDRQLLAEP